MKHKVSELEGALLDAAVAKVEAVELVDGCAWDSDLGVWRGWHPATDWRVGGPMIERERIKVDPVNWDDTDWIASCPVWYPDRSAAYSEADASGPTPLIAAMRAYVASKFGDDVHLP